MFFQHRFCTRVRRHMPKDVLQCSIGLTVGKHHANNSEGAIFIGMIQVHFHGEMAAINGVFTGRVKVQLL